MKKLQRKSPIWRICIAGLAIIAASITITLLSISKNAASEYNTANAIDLVILYVQHNDGRWPSSERSLESEGRIGSGVYLDYTVTSSQLLNEPERLQEALKPVSEKFFIYPNYEEKLKQLLDVLRETNQKDNGQATSPFT